MWCPIQTHKIERKDYLSNPPFFQLTVTYFFFILLQGFKKKLKLNFARKLDSLVSLRFGEASNTFKELAKNIAP
jgi:hypothetical protein